MPFFIGLDSRMATMTLYATVVTSSEFPDPEDAQGSPASGNNAPYATKAIVAGTAALTASFAATPVPGTITEFSALLTVRSSGVGTLAITRAGMTFSGDIDLTASGNFGITGNTASAFTAATLKANIEAGLTGLIATFAAVASTIDAKGFGFTITYTPDAAHSQGPKDADDTLLITGNRR